MSKVVFITGVSSGVGYGLAAEYLSRGDTVIGVSRRAPDLTNHPKFSFASVDLADEMSVKTVLEDLIGGRHRLDTVVLNAGILGELSDMKDVSLAELRRTMDVNVWANKTVLDLLFANCPMIQRVMAISSGAAVNGNRGWSGYSISKAALNMLVMLYARENPDTFFAAIAPGLIDTAMQDYLCGHPTDSRFPSLNVLKSKRGTAEMPNPQQAAKKLVLLFETVDNHIQSGEFIDIRHLPEFSQM